MEFMVEVKEKKLRVEEIYKIINQINIKYQKIDQRIYGTAVMDMNSVSKDFEEKTIMFFSKLQMIHTLINNNSVNVMTSNNNLFQMKILLSHLKAILDSEVRKVNITKGNMDRYIVKISDAKLIYVGLSYILD